MGMRSGMFTHPQLGPVCVRLLSTAVRFTARWKDGICHITAPARASAADIASAIDALQPHLAAMRPVFTPFYHDGYIFENDIFGIEVHEDRFQPDGRVSVTPVIGHRARVLVSPGALSSSEIERDVVRVIKNAAFRVAASVLPPEFTAIATTLRLVERVRKIDISRAATRLGTCSSRGEITLSRELVFMPADLRRAVYTHELAHLDHFDHSPAFHARWTALYGAPTAACRRLYSACPLPYPRR